MNISIKKRIYFSFFLLVLLFVVNGIVSVITLNKNRRLSEYVSTVSNPSLQALEDFEDMLVVSKMYTTNWVFLRANQDDKNALKRLHSIDYPRLKLKLILLSSKWDDSYITDSLNKISTAFDELLVIEKAIMRSLQKFEDYDDPVARLESERLVDDEILPRTAALSHALSGVVLYELNIRNQKNNELEISSMDLRILVSVLSVTIVFMGIFLSLYMARKIINPIKTIRHIVNDLGKGKIITEVNYKISNDEIGEMFRSVNNLSKKLQDTASFATEVGNRNFNTHFEPLGPHDNLGIALLAMRNNIKLSDEKFNEAQHLSHIGSWEKIIQTGQVLFSDEIFNIFDVDAAFPDFQLQSLTKCIHPDDLEGVSALIEKKLHISPFSFECRIITTKGVAKNIFVQTKVVQGKYGGVEKSFGIIQDITERKQAEEKITEEKELFRTMIESMPDQIYLKDVESRFLLCNMPVAYNAGLQSQQEMIGKTDFDFYSAENAAQFFEGEQNLVKSGQSIINQEQYTLDKATGKMRWSLTTKVPLKNHAGEIIGLIGINRDITNRKISEKKIEDVNRELGILFNSIHEVFFSVDMVHLQVIQISKSCKTMYGYDQSDFLLNYKLWLQIIHPDDMHVIEKEDEIMQSGQQVNNEYRIIRKDKNIRWVETKITPTLNEDGQLIRVDGVTRDITERKQAEKELERSFSLLEATIESTADGILVADIKGKIVMYNKKFVELWRMPKEVLASHDDSRPMVFVSDQLKNPGEFVSKIKELDIDRESVSFNVFTLKDGRTFEMYSQPQLINGLCVGRVWNFRDITERKLAEEQLFEVSQRLQLATRAAKVGIWDLDVVNNKLFWDDNMYLLYGIAADDFIGAYKAWEDGLHPDDLARGNEEIQMAVRGEKEFNTEFRVVWPDGSIHCLKANASVHRDESGKALRMIGTNWDITDSKNAEKALSLAQFTVENATNAIYWIKPDGSFYNLNNAAAYMLGYTVEELRHLSVPVIDPFYTDELWPLHWQDLRAKKALTLITKQRHKNGKLVDVEVYAHYFRFDNMEMNCAFVYDITERKMAEEKLIQSEKYNRNLFNQSTVGLALSRMDGTLVDVNEAYVKIIGLTIEESKKMSFYEITPKKYYPQEAERRKDLELTGRYGPYEKEYIHKDGHLVPVRLSGTILEKEGIKYIWSSVEDITDAKLAEDVLQKSESALELKNAQLVIKNAELEQFAYVASHDLQEPLRTTISFVQIFKQQYFGKFDAKADKYLSYIDQASDRMRVLIKDLLDFSRIGHNKDVEQVDCNKVIQDVIADVDKAIKDSHAKIAIEHLPVVSGYATELKQLFQNLLLNSIKFRKKNTSPQITITAQKKNDYWQFAFNDNGIGIDKQHNDRIFIIFQRLHTRSEYQGSGIGLSHCKKIVELHHGKIWVESLPNEGSTFYFTIYSPKEKVNEPKIELHNVN